MEMHTSGKGQRICPLRASDKKSEFTCVPLKVKDGHGDKQDTGLESSSVKKYTAMMSTGGQYEHSPLLDVGCRIQFPAILTISRKLPASFQERLRQDYPLFQATQDRRGYRFSSQDSLHLIVLTPNSVGGSDGGTESV
jgi:hypothetical protein